MPPQWPDPWFDSKFRQAVYKLDNTFQKLQLVCRLIEIERQNIYTNQNRKETENIFKYEHGLSLIPIYLDNILLYLRIIADNIADLTPYLYKKQQNGKQIAHRSFRDQQKWFVKHEEIDPQYTDILIKHSKWLERLSGKSANEGLRDKIIHYRGTFQVYHVSTDSDDFQLIAGMRGDSGWLIDNIFPELVKIVNELFLFLDEYIIHFSSHISEKIGPAYFDLKHPHTTEYFRFDEPLLFLWLFPRVNRTEDS